MATVKTTRAELKENRRNPSPFFARTYGGFTQEQEVFYLRHIGDDVNGKRFLDPMAGQGYNLSALAWRGSEVWLGDINPAPLHLAMLRDPELVIRNRELVSWFRKWFSSFKPRRVERVSEYCDDWISPVIREDLQKYVTRLDLSRNSTPFIYANDFWQAPIEIRFATSLPILAARSLSCFRGSDNLTWLKKGGLVREATIYHAIMTALDSWLRYATATLANANANGKMGKICARRMDAEQGRLATKRKFDAVITSPPYANRLDYTRMWAPELEVLSAMWRTDNTEIKAGQIGSTVVEGKLPSLAEEEVVPRKIRKILREIRNDESRASASYYYPFFRNYAISLCKSLPHLATRLSPGGLLIMFVRDTVRKDIMFPTAEMIGSVLQQQIGFRLVNREKRILRHHVGFLRKSSAGGMYGLAQVEWWLAFQKP
jgi:hypothetical protein